MFVSIYSVSRASSGLTMSVESEAIKFCFIAVTCQSKSKRAKTVN